MAFFEKLNELKAQKNSVLCVGIDPDYEKIPAVVRRQDDFLLTFCQRIIEATAPYCIAFKFNFAFFEAFGAAGWEVLARLRRSVPPHCLTVADAKRGDIGNSARHYAGAILEHLDFDAVTVNPYLGFDACEPFLNYSEKGLFILCLTSNPGAREIQDYPDGDAPLFLHIARRVQEINIHKNCGLVAGATKPDQLRVLCEAVPDLPLLMPGVGAQGGSLDDALQAVPHRNILVPISRSIIYAGEGEDFAEAAGKAAQALQQHMQRYL